jgi:hypothetical protein
MAGLVGGYRQQVVIGPLVTSVLLGAATGMFYSIIVEYGCPSTSENEKTLADVFTSGTIFLEGKPVEGRRRAIRFQRA